MRTQESAVMKPTRSPTEMLAFEMLAPFYPREVKAALEPPPEPPPRNVAAEKAAFIAAMNKKP